MKLVYSTLACPDWTIEQEVSAVARYGYDAIEWRMADGEVIGPQTADEIKQRLMRITREHKLEVAALDTSCKFTQANDQDRAAVVEEARRMTDLAVEIGTSYLRVFGGPIPEPLTLTDVLEPTAHALKEAAEYAAERGVTLLLETHDPAWSHSRNALALIEAAHAPSLAILWDAYHTFRMGESPQQTLEVLGSACAYVHVKDGRRGATQEWELCLPGEGEIPLQTIIDVLHGTGYNSYVSFEWEKKWHPELAEPEVALPLAATLLHRYVASLSNGTNL